MWVGPSSGERVAQQAIDQVGSLSMQNIPLLLHRVLERKQPIRNVAQSILTLFSSETRLAALHTNAKSTRKLTKFWLVWVTWVLQPRLLFVELTQLSNALSFDLSLVSIVSVRGVCVG